MTKLSKSTYPYISQINSCLHVNQLQPFFQAAIELEHATLPPYLTAKFSIKHGENEKIREVLRQIIKEEMLHMTIAANILNAIGGSPKILTEDFVPRYPASLPFKMKDNLHVNLTKYTPQQVRDVFMIIEEPDLIIPIEGSTSQNTRAIDNSIGEFYLALRDKLKSLVPNGDLPGDPTKQVTSKFYPTNELFPIINTNDALRAIDIIIEQGEGSQVEPLSVNDEMAHYYKFLELFEQKTIIRDKSGKYSLGLPDIPFQASGVYNIFPNTKANHLPAGSESLQILNNFNEVYSQILLTLEWAFNGQVEKMDQSLGLMFHLQILGERLCKTPFPGKPGINIGPSFEISTKLLNAYRGFVK